MQNNQLALASSDIIGIANAFYQSGMFPDIKSGAQAIVKIQAGQEFGIPPFAAMTGIHIIQGKPTVGGGLIASKVKSSGKYDYKLLEKTALICRIEFFENGESQGIESFTIDQARAAGTQNLAKYPANMLFNRCISNGQKAYAPDVFFGPVYTPEEFGAEDTSADVTTNENKAQLSSPAVVMPAKTAKPFPSEKTEEYGKAIEFLKTGGTVDNLRVRYEIDAKLQADLEARSRLTSQEDIHKANANYVAPAAGQQQDLTADPF